MKPVVKCHHVIIKKASGKLFCHVGGPEKQFAWPYVVNFTYYMTLLMVMK